MPAEPVDLEPRLAEQRSRTRSAFAAGRYLRVVNWHNTPASQRRRLRRELAWYLERFDPVRPEHLDAFTDTGTWPMPRPGFLPAFWDGYRNHATVAGPVCDELGISAWFFPPTGFLDCEAEQQRSYAAAHDIDLVAEEPDGPWAMSWDDLATLAVRHTVAAHTAHHVPATAITTEADIRREVHDPVRRLTEVTGRAPASFAFLLGTAPVAGTLAGDGVLGSGVRYATTNTSYLRIAD